MASDVPMSTHAMHVQKDMDGFCYINDEMQHPYLFPAVASKDGGGAESGDALTFFQSRLTKGRSSIAVTEAVPVPVAGEPAPPAAGEPVAQSGGEPAAPAAPDAAPPPANAVPPPANAVPPPANAAPLPANAALPAKPPDVAAGSLLHVFLVMNHELDQDAPASRSSYLVSSCLRVAASPAARAPGTPLWFDVPLARLSAFDYARFVYIFIEVVYNPYKKLGLQQETGEKDAKGAPVFANVGLIPCTFEDAARYFAWLHLTDRKLAELGTAACEPLPGTPATTSPYEALRQNIAETRKRFEAHFDGAADRALARNLSAKETRESAVRAALRDTIDALHGANATAHKALAKAMSVPVTLVHVLHLWARDTHAYAYDGFHIVDIVKRGAQYYKRKPAAPMSRTQSAAEQENAPAAPAAENAPTVPAAEDALPRPAGDAAPADSVPGSVQ